MGKGRNLRRTKMITWSLWKQEKLNLLCNRLFWFIKSLDCWLDFQKGWVLTNPAAVSEWENTKDSTAGFMCTPDEHPGVPYNTRDSYLSEPCHTAGKSLPLLSHTLLFCPFLQFSGWRHWELLWKGKIKKLLTFITDLDKKTQPSTTPRNAIERQASNTKYLNLFVVF